VSVRCEAYALPNVVRRGHNLRRGRAVAVPHTIRACRGALQLEGTDQPQPRRDEQVVNTLGLREVGGEARVPRADHARERPHASPYGVRDGDGTAASQVVAPSDHVWQSIRLAAD
jgi:hypothetical protein